MFLAPLPMVYIFLSLFILQECVLMLMTSTAETIFVTAKAIRVLNCFKYNVGLKTLLQQGISEPVLYVNLVYKFKKNCWKT